MKRLSVVCFILLTATQLAAQPLPLAGTVARAQALERGVLVLRDDSAARELYALAASAGNVEAQTRLALMLRNGIGGPADPEGSVSWLKNAAALGHAPALFALGESYETGFGLDRDLPAAAAAYLQAFEAGSVEAGVNLGTLHLEGRGVPKDIRKARRLFEQAAGSGSARGANNLGLFYVRGDDVAIDYERAYALFSKAAQAGLRPAIRNLAGLYDNGFGVEQSDSRAEELYKLAAGAGQDLPPLPPTDPLISIPAEPHPGLAERLAAGDPVAQFVVSHQILATIAPDRDLDRAYRLMTSAARQGLAPALAGVGWFWQVGFAVPKNDVEARAWYLLAAAAGFAPAAVLARAQETAMTQDQINRSQQLARLRMGTAK